MSPLDFAFGLATLVATIAAALVAGHRFSRLAAPQATVAERALHTGFLAWAIVVFGALALGSLPAPAREPGEAFAIGPLHPLFHLTLVAAVAAVALLLERRARSRTPTSADPPVTGPTPESLTARLTHAAFIVLYVVVAWHFVDRSLRQPPLAWDALQYHLPIVAEWIQHGTLGSLQHPHALFQSYFPATGELTTWLFMAPLRSDLLVGLPGLGLLALQGFALFRIAVRMGAPPAYARIAPALYLLTPCVLRLAPTSYVEPAFGAALFAAVAFLLDYRDERRPAQLFLCGLALAVLVGIKYTGILCAAPIAAFGLYYAARSGRRAFAAVALSLPFALLGAYWYWRNLAATGHPFFPMPVELFGFELFPGIAKPLGGARLGHGVTILSAFGPLVESGDLGRALIGSSEPDRYELGVGPKILPLFLLTLIGVVVSVRRGALRAPVLLFAAFAAIFVTTPFWLLHWLYVNMRFIAPALGMMAVLSVVVVWLGMDRLRMGRSATPVARLLPSFAGLCAAACVWPDLAALEWGFDARFLAGLAVLAALTKLLLRTRALRIAVACAALLGGAFALYPANEERERGRNEAYASRSELYRTTASLYAAGWAALDRAAPSGEARAQGRAATIRIAHVGFAFIYPLYGRALDRAVFYVHVDARGGALHDYPRAEARTRPDAGAWLENLAAARATHLVVHHPDPGVAGSWPVEAEWAETRPRRFKRVFSDRWVKIFSVSGPP